MNRFVLLSMLLLLPTSLLAGELSGSDYFQPVPMSEVARLMHRAGVVILDVNVQEVWEKHHVPGAVHVVSEDLGKFLPADKSSTLIFYCAGPLCRSSAAAANESIMRGYRRVYVMTDGIFNWIKGGYPVESSSPAKNRVPKHDQGDKAHNGHNH